MRAATRSGRWVTIFDAVLRFQLRGERCVRYKGMHSLSPCYGMTRSDQWAGSGANTLTWLQTCGAAGSVDAVSSPSTVTREFLLPMGRWRGLLWLAIRVVAVRERGYAREDRPGT